MPTKTKATQPETQARKKIEALEKPELTGVPALMCDLLGDIIVNGSTQRNLNAIVYACIDHHRRNLSWADYKGEQTRESEARESAERQSPVWLDSLAAFRHSRRLDEPETEQATPDSVSDRIRRAVKDELRGKFNAFLTDASPEDALLMASIMLKWDDRQDTGPENASHESALGIAFAYALASDRTYIQVPRNLVDHITSYANALANKTAIRKWKPVLKTDDELPNRLKVAEAAVQSDLYHLWVLAAAVEVIESHRGCMTPSEEFLCQVLRSYGGDGVLNPADVEDSLKEFKENLALMASAARNFARRSPKLMAEEERKGNCTDALGGKGMARVNCP